MLVKGANNEWVVHATQSKHLVASEKHTLKRFVELFLYSQDKDNVSGVKKDSDKVLIREIEKKTGFDLSKIQDFVSLMQSYTHVYREQRTKEDEIFDVGNENHIAEFEEKHFDGKSSIPYIIMSNYKLFFNVSSEKGKVDGKTLKNKSINVKTTENYYGQGKNNDTYRKGNEAKMKSFVSVINHFFNNPNINEPITRTVSKSFIGKSIFKINEKNELEDKGDYSEYLKNKFYSPIETYNVNGRDGNYVSNMRSVTIKYAEDYSELTEKDEYKKLVIMTKFVRGVSMTQNERFLLEKYPELAKEAVKNL